jgi:hypothetical protein
MPLQFCHKLAKSLISEAGAINAAGAIIGLLVTGTVGGVAATSSGELINLAHDAAAQQNAAQIGTAQGLALIMDGSYTDLAGLEAEGHMPAYRASAGPRRFDTRVGADGTCFVTVSRSATGKLFFATDRISNPEPLLIGTATGCLSAGQVQSMSDSLEAASVGA